MKCSTRRCVKCYCIGSAYATVKLNHFVSPCTIFNAKHIYVIKLVKAYSFSLIKIFSFYAWLRLFSFRTPFSWKRSFCTVFLPCRKNNSIVENDWRKELLGIKNERRKRRWRIRDTRSNRYL